MDKKQVNRSCITNMKEKDPIIKKYMEEYMKGVQEHEELTGNNQLIVNFDITYPDGRCENFTCNGVSEVFGQNEQPKRKTKKEYIDLDKKCKSEYEIEDKKSNDNKIECSEKCNKKLDNNEYYDYENFTNDDYFDSEYFKNSTSDFFQDYSKSLNYDKKYNPMDLNENKQEEKECEDIFGSIIVYSYLRGSEDVELKGVPINLYKINGICPEFIECKKTDCNGKVCFDNIPKGSYRIIELINKSYFSKPSYIDWNEVNIDKDNKYSVIYVINKMK